MTTTRTQALAEQFVAVHQEVIAAVEALDLFGGATLTVRGMIEGVLVGHTRAHLASPRAAS